MKTPYAPRHGAAGSEMVLQHKHPVEEEQCCETRDPMVVNEDPGCKVKVCSLLTSPRCPGARRAAEDASAVTLHGALTSPGARKGYQEPNSMCLEGAGLTICGFLSKVEISMKSTGYCGISLHM